MAAGKSTVAHLLASRLERGVHLEGDVFRRSIVSGRAEMTPDASPEALEDVAAGPLLGEYRNAIRSKPCHVIVLVPSLESVVEREAGRPHKGYGAWTVEELYAGFVESTPRVGIWLDTTGLTPDETVDEIYARTPAGGP
jgi:hypothetical protein